MVEGKILHGTIYDGTGKEGYQGDLLIQEGKISDIGDFSQVESGFTIDATDLMVTPGFIDSHRHLEIQALENPNFGALELAQGITSAMGGNCGFAPYPTTETYQKPWYEFIAPCLGEAKGEYSFSNYEKYLQELEKKPMTMNVGGLAALGGIKSSLKGFDKSPFSPQEMDRAQKLLCETLEEGALGISCGIMYPPECYTTQDEYVKWLSPAGKFGRTLSCHVRGEGNGLVESVREVIEIGKKASLPVNISHLKSVGQKNWKSAIYQVAELIEGARSEGYPVTADFYPYTGGSTTLLSLIPPVFLQGTIQETLEKLEKKSAREELSKALYQEYPNWDNMVMDIGFSQIIISGVTKPEHASYSGRDIASLAQEIGKDPVDFISDLLVAEEGQVSILVMSMCQEDVDFIATLPYTALISDALYGTMTCPHPRLLSAFPKFLRYYVKEKALLSKEEAIHKMTAMTAKRFTLENRGTLTKGAIADINVFDLEKIADRADFHTAPQFATGISYTLLKGEVVMKESQLEKQCGTVLRP